MKSSRYSAEQVAFAMRQAESGTPVPEVCRKMGIAEQTFYRWKKKFAGMGVAEVLMRLGDERNLPKTIRVDNGPEFISKVLDQWAYLNGVALDFSRPGKPTDNAFIEAFNGRLRDECLNENWFLCLADAKEKVELWRQEYNRRRLHGALGNLAPMEFARIRELVI